MTQAKSKSATAEQAKAPAQEAAAKPQSVTIKFQKPHKRYVNKDIASFPVDEAEKILALDPAVAVKLD